MGIANRRLKLGVKLNWHADKFQAEASLRKSTGLEGAKLNLEVRKRQV